MRFYRALLRLYPASFRLEYRDELCRAFAERAVELSGPFAAVGQVAAALADVVPNAIAVHWDIARQDLGYAVRSLRRTPGFTLTTLLVVALGVGANTAVFSIADLVFVRPLPFAHPGRIVQLWETDDGSYINQASPANYRDWRTLSSSFSSMAAYAEFASNMVGSGEPRRLETVRATADLLPLMGVSPLIGRAFTAEEAATGHYAVLSYGLWQSHFGGDPGVLGTSIRLEGVPHTVLGVMPASFQFPARSVEAWTSLALHEDDYSDRTNSYLEVVARLRPGVSVEGARRELAVISARLERQYPQDNKDVRVRLFTLREQLGQRSRLLVIALCGAAFCILLLACANLASLFLARGVHRGRELAVRAALGAGRERLVRQLVTESVGVALLGGALGIGAAAMLVPLLTQLVPGTLPIAAQPGLDARVLTIAAAAMLVTGFAFGLAPALRAGGANGLDALRGGTRTAGSSTQRLRAGLVIVEIAASVVLLVTCGLLIRAVWRLQAIDPGFVGGNVLTLRTALPQPKYAITARRVQYYDRVLQEVRVLPGVREAAFTTGLPMAMRGGIWGVSIKGRELVRGDVASLRYVTPRYFATLRIPLRRGRDVLATDTREQPKVAVVSEAFAKHYWPGQDALGRRFTFALDERTVVGIVGDIRWRGREIPSEPQVYLPCPQVADSSIIGYTPKDLIVRTANPGEALALVPRIREIVKAADPEQPLSDVRMMSDIVADEVGSRVVQLRLLGALTGLALLIAGLGIHGLLSFAVARRSQELGVRRALGAQVSVIVGLVLREGLVLALVGLTIGAAVAYAAAGAMGALLAGVTPEDPLTLATAAALCLATTLAGCLRPALRAARVDPAAALRAD